VQKIGPPRAAFQKLREVQLRLAIANRHNLGDARKICTFEEFL
jgi:hypothetical protein